MAYRKVNDTSLASVADAIRSKGSTSDALVFPDGFVTAISAIQAGGGGIVQAPWNDVNFRDYDGTLMYSYTKDEALALAELPELPNHEGLTGQGWNWTLDDMKSQVESCGTCDIGALYITSDGKTRIYITLLEGRTSPMLGVSVSGTVSVDWGDGTEPDVLTGNNPYLGGVVWTPSHNYATAGEYVITLTVNGLIGLYGMPAQNEGSYLLRYSSSSDSRNCTYSSAIKKIELGSGINSVDNYAFCACYNLHSVVGSNKTLGYASGFLRDCKSIYNFNCDHRITSLGGIALSNCSALSSFSMPNKVKSIGREQFYRCTSLRNINIPSSVETIGDRAFEGCYSLVNVCIPSATTSIGSYAFRDCFSLTKIRFKPAAPPSVGSSFTFNGIPTDCIISVPVGSLSAYTSATNYPDPSIYAYIEEN